jgi:hypothetical protein
VQQANLNYYGVDKSQQKFHFRFVEEEEKPVKRYVHLDHRFLNAGKLDTKLTTFYRPSSDAHDLFLEK